jgi:hypothetical protein
LALPEGSIIFVYMALLFRFPPPEVSPADPTFLVGKSETFAKLKIESRAGKRTVFLTEHTLLFVIKGVKLLHFADYTLPVGPDSVVLLKKGIYVMAEYLQEGLSFEALLLFLPGNLLRSLEGQHQLTDGQAKASEPYLVFPANELTLGFKGQLRHYFNRSLADLDQLMPLKQKEILLLLQASGYRSHVDYPGGRECPADRLGFYYSYLCVSAPIDRRAGQSV